MNTLHQTALVSETVVSSRAVGKRRLRSVLLGVMSFMLVGQAQGDILSTTGAMTPISSPVSFLEGDTESSTIIGILDEGITFLSAGIFVNAVGPGTHTGSSAPPILIPAGAMVHTYIVHFDPAGGLASLTGSVTFDPGETIIGIQTHTPYLDTSDAVVGDPSATYPTGLLEFRAFETLPGTDTVTVPPGLGSASFALFAELSIDQARIVTIPEPAALSLLALGGLAVIRRRRR
ncbi:MAG: PEP-CTERM sorting domain-containing protein [Phycisphaerae bacterium]|jgi:hypothetical protein|nr:PEP-CTERM sorting domain-containing protein [Phycisphaerae bacterium]